jgi:hypothetical protein
MQITFFQDYLCEDYSSVLILLAVQFLIMIKTHRWKKSLDCFYSENLHLLLAETSK